jgi:hypothetical protein
MDPPSPLVLVFPSKVDGWIFGVMAAPLAISVAVIGAALAQRPPLPAVLLMVGVEVVVLLLISRTFHSTRYEVTSREVIARSGLFRWRIEIDGIESIRPSGSLASSPALSLDRLEIRYAGGRTLLVSPRDGEGFLQAVVERSRHLHRAGEHVRRV